MRRQIPRGDDDLVCPLHKKAMSAVCHKCPWWVQVRGKNPQSNEEIDQWNCAIAWGPILAVNTAQETRQGAAAVESFRNEMVRRHDTGVAVLAPPRPILAIEADNGTEVA